MILFPPFSCTSVNAFLTTNIRTPRVRRARVNLSTKDTDGVKEALSKAELKAKPIASREKQLRAKANDRRGGEDLRNQNLYFN